MTKNHLSLIYGLALSTGMVLVLMLGVEPVAARTVCPLPKVLVLLDLPNGKTQDVCVPASVALSLADKDGSGTDLGAVGDGMSLATILFSAVVKGLVQKAAGAATGWVLGAVGLTSGNDSSEQLQILDNISSELMDIEATLSMIDTGIADIDKAILTQTCDTLIDSTSDARSLIDTLTTDYNNFLADASGSDGFAPTLPPISTGCDTEITDSCVEVWADAVLDDSTTTSGVLNALNQIHEAMVAPGTGSGGGIISGCLDPMLVTPPQPGENDVDYYNTVASLMTAFYNYQARGLLLLVEAHHFRAWSLTSPPPTGDPSTDPASTSEICTMATDASVINACNDAVTDTEAVYAHLKAQYLLAGAPYIAADTADAFELRYTATGPPQAMLLAKSLEDFTGSAGDCTSVLTSGPLTSGDPCGLTVGNLNTATTTFGVSYGPNDPYEAWSPTTEPELSFLLEGQGQTQTPGEYLTTLGFGNMTNKVVITGSTTDFSLIQSKSLSGTIKPYTGSAVCFLDTDIRKNITPQPVCSQAALNEFWMDGEEGGSIFCGDVNLYLDELVDTVYTNIYLPGKRNGFYDLTLIPKSGSDECHYDAKELPGWDAANASAANAQQYRWPALSLADVTCTDKRSPWNASGEAFTRCGADFDAWFENIVPLNPPVSIEREMLPGPSGPVDCTDTASHWSIETGDFTLHWQSDGNLVIYDSADQVVWASKTADDQHGGNGGRLLTLNSNGLQQITDESGLTLFHQGPFD